MEKINFFIYFLFIYEKRLGLFLSRFNMVENHNSLIPGYIQLFHDSGNKVNKSQLPKYDVLQKKSKWSLKYKESKFNPHFVPRSSFYLMKRIRE